MLMKAVHTYLELRRATGFKLQEVERHLHHFVEFATERGDFLVKRQTVMDWVMGATKSKGQRIIRLKNMTRFALFARAEDGRHEIPPDSFFGRRKQRPTPFIYSQDDITRLVQAAAGLGPPGSLRPHTFSTLFALLAVTGLRISEALALRLDEVTPDGLVIRDTKFHKSRLVPLHETARKALDQYIQRRQRIAGASSRLFVSRLGKSLSYGQVYYVFRQLLKTIGLDSGVLPHRPRVHDLRHSFAVRALQACPEGRDYVGRHMLALSTYLGHTGVSNTYWYLQATPQLMRDIADACDGFFDGGQQ
jgi:integrase/recombinase XerD